MLTFKITCDQNEEGAMVTETEVECNDGNTPELAIGVFLSKMLHVAEKSPELQKMLEDILKHVAHVTDALDPDDLLDFGALVASVGYRKPKDVVFN